MSRAIRKLLKIQQPPQPQPPPKMATGGTGTTADTDYDAMVSGWTDEQLVQAGVTRENLKQKIIDAMKISALVQESLEPTDEAEEVVVETFQDRSRYLGALSRKLALKIGEANSYLDQAQYRIPILDQDDPDFNPDAIEMPIISMGHADKLMRDCEQAYSLLEAKRIWTEELLSEEELEQRGNYLGPKLTQLNNIRVLYGMRQEYEANQKADNNADVNDPQTTAIDNLAQTMTTMMGANYELKSHVSFKFSGKLIDYPAWIEQVNLGLAEMRRLQKPPSQMLIELKQCCAGDALKQIKHLVNTGENLDHALKLLQRLFGDKSVYLQYIIQKTFKIRKMDDTTSSLLNGLSDVENIWSQICNVKMDPEEFALRLYIAIVQPKLSGYAAKKWEENLNKSLDDESSTGSKKLEFKDFTKCIDLALKNCQRGDITEDDKKGRKDHPDQKRDQHQNLPHDFHTRVAGNFCHICSKKEPKHWPAKCPLVFKKSKDELLLIQQKKKLCMQCLTPGHSSTSRQCYFFKAKCTKKDDSGEVCGNQHHPAFCKNRREFGVKSFHTKDSRKDDKEEKPTDEDEEKESTGANRGRGRGGRGSYSNRGRGRGGRGQWGGSNQWN